ncbi:DUF4157 domain-containing protein [Streptomyces sp. NPDC057654]|uniref:eCIS core domain-containing protein n=1 Tax=Streptomyces sp. NPDC057654 TaxID=3346196 RepID=UPI0036887F80
MRSQSEQTDAGTRSAARRPRDQSASALPPLTAAEVTSIQRLAASGPAMAVARASDQEQHVHGAGCGHGGPESGEATAPGDLLKSAMSSPSRPLGGSLRSEADSFYQNDFSAARIHDNDVAQRATEAMGAQAMTVGSHVFLGPGAAGNKEVMGHELGHVDKNLRGVRETGNDNGSGVNVTDPQQSSERTAEADGAAFAAGAETAPSVQRSVDEGAVTRMRSLQGAAGNRAVARMLSS